MGLDLQLGNLGFTLAQAILVVGVMAAGLAWAHYILKHWNSGKTFGFGFVWRGLLTIAMLVFFLNMKSNLPRITLEADTPAATYSQGEVEKFDRGLTTPDERIQEMRDLDRETDERAGLPE